MGTLIDTEESVMLQEEKWVKSYTLAELVTVANLPTNTTVLWFMVYYLVWGFLVLPLDFKILCKNCNSYF